MISLYFKKYYEAVKKSIINLQYFDEDTLLPAKTF